MQGKYSYWKLLSSLFPSSSSLALCTRKSILLSYQMCAIPYHSTMNQQYMETDHLEVSALSRAQLSCRNAMQTSLTDLPMAPSVHSTSNCKREAHLYWKAMPRG